MPRLLLIVVLVVAVAWLGFQAVRAFDPERHAREAAAVLSAPDTVTQYLQPTRTHLNLQRFVPPEEFAELKAHAEGLGFAHVESGALVRSSYHAGEMHKAAVRKQRGRLPAWAAADA